MAVPGQNSCAHKCCPSDTKSEADLESGPASAAMFLAGQSLLPPRKTDQVRHLVQMHLAALGLTCSSAFENTACDLVGLDRFEQGFEIPFAEAIIALALDEFEEDRPDHGL